MTDGNRKVVLSHGAKVYVACRSEEKAIAAIKELKEQTGKNDLHFVLLDLSNLASVKKATEELKRCECYPLRPTVCLTLRSKEKKIDILFYA